MAQCPYCGKNNPSSSSSCAYCGSPMGNEDAYLDEEYLNDRDSDQGEDGATSPAQGSKSKRKTKTKTKSGGKGIQPSALLAAAGGVLGIGLIVGLVMLLTSALSPMAPVARAMDKTLDALQSQTGKLSGLDDFVSTFADVQDARKTYSSATIGFNLVGADSVYVNLDCYNDTREELASGALSLGLEEHGAFSTTYSVSSTDIHVAVPQLLNNTMFQFTYDDLAARLNQSDGTTRTGKDLNPYLVARQAESRLLTDAEENLRDAVKDWVSSAELQEQEPTSVSGVVWTPYLLQFQEESREALVLAAERYLNALASVYPPEYLDLFVPRHESWEQFTGSVTQQLRAYQDFRVCIDERGYLVSLSFSDGTQTTELSLEGGDNPWQSFYVYQDQQVMLRGNVLTEEDTVTIACTDNYSNSIRLTYNDTTGDYSLQLMDVLTLEGYVRSFRGGVEFSAKLDLTVAQVWFTCLTQKTSQEPVALEAEKVYNPLNTLGSEILKSIWNDTNLAQEIQQGLDSIVQSIRDALLLETP